MVWGVRWWWPGLLLGCWLWATVAQAAPLTLAWDCPSKHCAAYNVYYDVGCVGAWTFWGRMPTAESFVLTPAGLTCWTVTSLDTYGAESAYAVPIYVMLYALTAPGTATPGYVVNWYPWQGPAKK